jgi:hypothetical protein
MDLKTQIIQEYLTQGGGYVEDLNGYYLSFNEDFSLLHFDNFYCSNKTWARQSILDGHGLQAQVVS